MTNNLSLKTIHSILVQYGETNSVFDIQLDVYRGQRLSRTFRIITQRYLFAELYNAHIEALKHPDSLITFKEILDLYIKPFA